MALYYTCQVKQGIWQTGSEQLTSFCQVTDPAKEGSRECVVGDQAPAGGIRAGAAGSRPSGPSDRVLHLPVAHGKRAPPAPNRTDIYDRMDKFLKLPTGELARLADHERKEQLKRELGDEPAPLFREVRALILRKCEPNTERHVRAVFEKQPFGELE